MFYKRLWTLLFVALVSSSATVMAQDELSGGDKRWMEEEVAPLITKQEMATFQQINKDDRKLFKELFWARRDPAPMDKGNAFQENYESRVEAADDNFKARAKKGSQTDLGYVFLLLGAPDEQVRGGRDSVDMSSLGAGADVTGSPGGGGRRDRDDPSTSPSAGGSSFDIRQATNGGNTITWVYAPNAQLGIPDGLKVEFLRQEQLGYRMVNGDELDDVFESVKERFIFNPGINYALNEKGRLLKLDDAYDPNSPAKQILKALQDTGETSSDIKFDVTPAYFRSTGGQVYVPFDINVTAGLNSDKATIYGAIENADGITVHQFEESASLSDDAGGGRAFEFPVQLAPGLYTLYMGVLEGQTNGSSITDFEVPDYATDEFSLSSILMFSEGKQTGDAMGSPGRAFLVGGYHFTPKRNLVYTHKEQLAGVFNAYNFGVEGGEPKLTLQCMFFKDGQKRGQTGDEPFMLQSAEAAVTIFDIPLSLPNFKDPGQYKLEIRITDHVTKEVLKKEIEFEVVGG